MTGVRHIAIAALAIGATAASTAARPGKVVRVERQSTTAARPIALCTRISSDLTCITGGVERGDELEVVDDAGGYQRLRVTQTQPGRMSCNAQVVEARAQVLETRAAGNRSLRHGAAFGGLDLVPGRSRTIDAGAVRAPPGARGVVRVALDISGDGQAEVAITVRECPETQRLTPGLAGRPNVQSLCIGTWHRADIRSPWREVSDEAIHICQ
jgi:hypothetical protein